MNFIDISWSSFDEYLKYLGTLSSNRKKTVRREINRNRREGTVVKQLRVSDEHEDRLHQLLDMNSYKHNGRPFSFSRSFFLELQSNLGNDAVFYASWKAGGKRLYIFLLGVLQTDDGCCIKPHDAVLCRPRHVRDKGQKGIPDSESLHLLQGFKQDYEHGHQAVVCATFGVEPIKDAGAQKEKHTASGWYGLNTANSDNTWRHVISKPNGPSCRPEALLKAKYFGGACLFLKGYFDYTD
ncbi:MAG: N-acetyltransferase [Deltaproteobacteria bacterium]|nr:N-acetyltransferase [Deltaproteobacteria bacterium]